MRTLIVDDEPLARERLRALMAADNEVEVIGECADGPSAVTAIREKAPDLVFLDVQMPAMDGLSVCETVGPEKMPPTIFVTAFDQYAVRAFDVDAVDYLLKPFDRPRFQAALQRAKDHVRQRSETGVRERLMALLADAGRAESANAAGGASERLAVKTSGKVVFLRADEIDWIEAAGNYSRLHVGKKMHLLRETMTALEGRLDPRMFVRIHRSTIINLERVRELQPYFHGDYIVVLHDGTQLTLSRTHRQKLHEIVGHPF